MCHAHYFSVSVGGGVILYAGSSGSSSPSPGSPSSGYQTQSPSSHSQPSSPEEVTFTEIGVLKQRAVGSTTSSSKLVFQFPEVYSNPPAAAAPQHTYAHPIAGKRPCGFTGTFTSKWFFREEMLDSFFFLMQFHVCFNVTDEFFFFNRDRWNGPAMQSLRGHCIWLPLWSARLRGLQGKKCDPKKLG